MQPVGNSTTVGIIVQPVGNSTAYKQAEPVLVNINRHIMKTRITLFLLFFLLATMNYATEGNAQQTKQNPEEEQSMKEVYDFLRTCGVY